jgi:mono/diheme cytochrome c family protein
MYRNFYLTIALITGLLFFVFMLIAGFKSTSPEWKKYQSEYKELLIKNVKDEATRKKAKSFDIKIQQIYLSSLKRVDRCTSCHIGVENPLMADAEIVYKQHSGNSLQDHPISKFGCTICHNGQGRATNLKEAHGVGRDTYWDYPILPSKYIQSTCALCHDLDMLKQNGGEIVATGETLFREKGCKGCHKLNGVGGIMGQALDGIGSQPITYFPMKYVQGEHTVYAWLKQHFDDPQNIVPESEMKIHIKADESDLLTTYTLTLKAVELPRKYRRIWQSPQSREAALDGEALYKTYCIACHNTGKYSIYDEVFKRTIPAIMNPAFLKSIDDKFLKKIIEEGRSETQMTAWKADAAGLSDEKINKILQHITRDRPAEKSEPFVFSRFNQNLKNGEELYKVRCEICHGSDGEGGEKILGISLVNHVVQQEADPEFLAITVRDGRKRTPMAAFGGKDLGLNDQEIVNIVAYVKKLSAQ